ncbi:MAG TPA: hypothetical protein DIW26_02305 [Ruminococcus sp.]|nr:hypothetical protein [Ruminococcus sp.]
MQNYRGHLINSDDFPYYSERASDFIDSITFSRLKTEDYSEYDECIKKCCCALAEITDRHEKLKSSCGKASETIGKYSVSYQTVQSDDSFRNDMLKTAKMHLRYHIILLILSVSETLRKLNAQAMTVGL